MIHRTALFFFFRFDGESPACLRQLELCAAAGGLSSEIGGHRLGTKKKPLSKVNSLW